MNELGYAEQQMLQKMTHLFESLPPFSEVLPAQFFDDPELHFVETDACSVVFDQPGNLGDEIDVSSSDEDSDERRCLWDLNFGWFGCGAETEDSADFFNKNPVAQHLQICMNHGFWVCKLKVPQMMLQSFPMGFRC